jgi:hypothetical protein
MSYRRFVLTAALAAMVVWLSQPPAAAQVPPSSAKAKAAAEKWNPPRTPDGQPDLQGYWTNATTTPLERPTEFTGKQILTEQEAPHSSRQHPKTTWLAPFSRSGMTVSTACAAAILLGRRIGIPASRPC